jgi:predicted esterase
MVRPSSLNLLASFAVAAALLVAAPHVLADGAAKTKTKARAQVTAPRSEEGAAKPWCAPDVHELHELEDHVCFAEGGTPEDGRRTLVVYMHGAYATTPGFAWLQQRAMALHAKRLGFTVLLPTSPKASASYVWPTSEAAQKAQEAEVLAGIARAKRKLEARLGHTFDETFVVGFSSGAYYASTVAVRGALDVDGYVVLAGGSSWARSHAEPAKRAPVFVGVSAADPQTANHSRAFAGTLATLGWPYRVMERSAGHEVDGILLTQGISWLRAQKQAQQARPAGRTTVAGRP